MPGIQLVGATSGVAAEVETNTKAERTVGWPKDVGALGAYALAMDNGATVMTAGLGAAAEIFQFRWTHATNLCVLRSIRFSTGSVVAFVAGRYLFEAVAARVWSADGTLGTAATLTVNNQKKRTSFGTTLLGTARIANTVALGAGTKTLDAQAFANIALGAPTTIGPIINPATYLWTRDTSDEYPFVFATNEGFAIRATVPGTGTWYFGVQVEWAEVQSY